MFTIAAAAGVVEHIQQFIPGVIGISGDVGTRSSATKSTLSASGVDTRPGMAQMSRGDGVGGGASVGRVQGGSSIAHADMHVRQLPIVQATPLGVETADATEMGSFVRQRVAQLQTCYERAGGTDLAGVVALRVTVGAGGTVQSADIARRSWSGPAAAATEGCLLNMVKAWRIPFAAEGTTVTIPISFTRGS
jgi:TonB family protein